VLTGFGATVRLSEVAPGRANLTAHLGGEQTGGGLLFLGHSDVVPAGHGWDADAFTPREKQGRLIGRGATAVNWSANHGSLLYVRDDALWLLPTLTSQPVRIATPLFPPNNWPQYYAEIAWSAQFAWSPR
jgi:acetylornithine deacetylase